MAGPRDQNDYQILIDDDYVGLTTKVQAALRDGWQLAGGVALSAVTLSTGESVARFCQAICAPGRN